MRPVDLLNATVSLRDVTVERGLAYGPHPRQVVDIWRPAAATGSLPVAVFFYGGSWQWGSRADYRFVAAPLARRGVIVVVPDYRLFPEVRFPDFIADGARAVAWARDLAGNGARTSVVGHSAGAYIAAMLALDPTWGVRDTLAGAVGIAGPYDFLPIQDPAVRAVFADAADARDTQPINHVDGGNAPLLLLHGAADTTCYPRNSLALAARIRAVSGPVMVHTYPRVGHLGTVAAFAPLLRWHAPVLAHVAAFVGTAPAWASAARHGMMPPA